MDDVVAAIARRELGETADRVREFDEGLLHESYELRCGGEAYVLQFAAGREDDRADSLARGLYWYDALQGSRVPVPRVASEGVREYDGRRYGLVEKLPGTSGERDVSPARTRNAAVHLAHIHEFRRFDAAGWIRLGDEEPTVVPLGEGGLAGWIRRTAADSAATLRAAGLETAGREVERLLDGVGSVLPGEFDPVLCHDDFSPDNVLFDGEEVVGVLDFDRAWASHHQRDLVAAANAFWMHDPTADWEPRATFYEGYRQAGDPGEGFADREPLYRVETLARTVAGMEELGELSEYEREFYGERILAAIDRARRRG